MYLTIYVPRIPIKSPKRSMDYWAAVSRCTSYLNPTGSYRIIYVSSTCGLTRLTATGTGITEEYIENSDHLYARMVRNVLTPEERRPPRKLAGLGEFIIGRGNHYRPLFRYLKSHECKNIMEIGTYNGENAVQMIKAAAIKVNEEDIHYYGFDLFENITQTK